MNFSNDEKDTIKEGYNNDYSNAKNTGKQVLKIVLYSLKLIIQIMIFMLLNGSLVFFIKYAGNAVLNKKLPSNCKAPPFGSAKDSPCDRGEHLLNQIINDVAGSDTDGSNISNAGAGIPYKWYRKDPQGIFQTYVSWYIHSLAIARTSVNSIIKSIMQWANSTIFATNSILILTSLITFLFALPLIHFLLSFLLIVKQVFTFWTHGILMFILSLCTIYFVGSADLFISLFITFKIFFELTIKPFFIPEQRKEILKIVRKENILIGYILGFTFLRILWKIKMNKNIEYPIKIIPTVIFFLILIIHFIKHIHNILFKGSGNKSRK